MAMGISNPSGITIMDAVCRYPKLTKEELEILDLEYDVEEYIVAQNKENN